MVDGEHGSAKTVIPFFVIRNNHSPDCGEPPTIGNDPPGKYLGYFENAYGEQWVFVYDQATGAAELRGGDAGWENSFPVEDGRVAGLVLNKHEVQWLQACWAAATDLKRQ
jgi:hypothetical protein